MAIGAVFDDIGTKFLGDAFDAVFTMLHGAQYPDDVREVIRRSRARIRQGHDRARPATVSPRGRRQSGDQIVKGMQADAASSYQRN
jgi:hypothetical protein